MIDILSYWRQGRKTKTTPSGWVSGNAPCCVHNGESADRRQRGGFKVLNDSWSYSCFNCGFTASFVAGRNLGVKARRLLSWLNVPPEEIERINLESLRHRSIQGILDDRQRTTNVLQNITFTERDLPDGFALVDATNTQAYQYLRQRRVPEDYPIGMTTTPHDAKRSDRPGIIVPFTSDGKIVGSTTRFLDDRNPRYIHDMQPGYVFGTDLQQPSWQHVVVVEGVFDALSIGGVAVLHADINDAQAAVIRNLGRDVTVVPDQDSAGMRLVDRAVELGWAVSMPDWPGCKDVNDAVIQYGRLPTLLMILAARETSRLKIELRRREVAKRLRS